MRTEGKISSWNDDKGYGFISPLSAGKQVFVHVNAFKNRSRRPAIGKIVTYGLGADKQGRPCAIKVTLSGDRIKQNAKKKSGTFLVAIAISFLGVIAISVLGSKLPLIVLAAYAGISVFTYLAYALDKSAAKNGDWRTQESTLHLFSFAVS